MINTSFYHIDKDINKLLDKASNQKLTQEEKEHLSYLIKLKLKIVRNP